MLKNAVLFISSLVSIVTFAAPIVTDVVAKQRYPWNGLVDVRFTITGSNDTKYYTSFVAKDVVGDINVVIKTVCKPDGTIVASREPLSPGTYNWVWDTAKDLPNGFESGRMTITIMVDKKEIVCDSAQLWSGGPYWATMNIGAKKPEDYGYYFWWGDTVGYKRQNVIWVASDGSNSNYSFNNAPTDNKDILTLLNEGWISSSGVLSLEHDAAQVQWGGNWRMPTKQDFEDLINKCNWKWTRVNGVDGYLISGKGAYTSENIFLPCAGYGYGSSIERAGSYGAYWSSEYDSSTKAAWGMYFYWRSLSYLGVYSTDIRACAFGQPIRPLQRGVISENVGSSIDEKSCEFALFKVNETGSLIMDPIAYNSTWIGGDSSAEVVISVDGSEIMRRRGDGDFAWSPITAGKHTLTYTTYINGIAQDEVYEVTIFKDWKYAVEDGKAVIIETSQNSGHVSIPMEIDGYRVDGLKDGLFAGCDNITSVSMPGCLLTKISDIFPDSFEKLTSITLLDGTVEIPERAFAGCTALREVIIPKSVVKIGKNVFEGCSSLDLVTQDGFIICQGWCLGYAGGAAISLCIPNGVYGVADGAFKDHTSLQSITFPTSLRFIGEDAFAGCTGIEEILLPEGLARVNDRAFCNCTYAQTVKLPSTLQEIGDRAFENCTSFSSVECPEALKIIGAGAFSNCWRMLSVSLPVGVESIGENAFLDCRRLIGVSAPTHLKTIKELFPSAYANLATIEIADTENTLVPRIFAECSSLIEVEISEGIRLIPEEAFVGCSAVQSFNLPNTITNIGARAFSGLTQMTSFAFPAEVETIADEAFAGCANLASLSLPEGVKHIGSRAFDGLALLARADIPGTVVEMGELPFAGCGQVRAVSMPGNVATVKSLFPDAYGEIVSASVTVGTTCVVDRLFADCTKLTSVDLPFTLVEIGEYAFENCTFLADMGIPSGVERLGEGAFLNCASLAKIALPNRLVIIPYRAFAGCETLAEIVIPENVSELDDSIFVGCLRLSKVYFVGNAPSCTVSTYDGVSASLVTYVENGSTGWDGIETSKTLPEFWPEGTSNLITYWTPNRYDVTFNLSGGGDPFDVEQVTGTTYILPLDPKRKGAVFDGWWTSLDGGARVTAVTPVDLTRPHTFYARWKFNVYSVVFDANGGSGEMKDQRLTVETPVQLPENGFTRPGYEFLGWATAPDGEVVYSDKAEVVNLAYDNNAIVTLYAVWNEREWTWADAVDVTSMGLVFSGDGDNDAEWEIDYSTSHDGVASLKSGVIGASAEYPERTMSMVKTEVVGEGIGEFWWKVNCEEMDAEYDEWYDYVVFTIDGEEVAKIAGDSGWQKVEYIITGAGKHTLAWTFTRDYYDEEGVGWENAAWLDEFVWTPNPVTVTFDAGGADGEIPDPVVKYAGYELTLPGAGTLNNGEYVFRGWSDGETTYQAGATYVFGSADVTLTAVWELKVWTFAEAADAEGLVLTTGGDADWTIDATSGYTNTMSVKSGVVVSGQESWIETKVNGPGILTFRWKVMGGENRNQPFAFAKVMVDGVQIATEYLTDEWEELSLPIEGNKEHTVRWIYLRTSTRVADGDCAWIDAVMWMGGARFDITYENLKGATHQNPSAYYAGMSVKFTDPSTVDGYVFTGWMPSEITASDTGNKIITANWEWTPQDALVDASITGGKPITVKADWVKTELEQKFGAGKKESFITKFGDNLTSAMTKKTGKRDSAGNELLVWHDYVAGTDPTDINSIFKAKIDIQDGKPVISWEPNLNSAGEERVYTVYGKESLSDIWHAPIAVLDHFFKVDVAMPREGTVTFDVGGGSSVNPISVRVGQEVGELPTPTRDGYKFLGWFTAAEGGDAVTLETVVTADMTIYAHWTIKSYMVEFNANGGNGGVSKSYTHGAALDELPTPTRDGYTFAGWWTAASGGAQVTVSTVVSADMTIYAHWTIKSYTVEFNANGGNGGVSKSYTHGAALGELPTPTREGYTFAGWWTAANGGTQVTVSTVVLADMTIYAHWTIKSYTVVFNANGGSGGVPKSYNHGATLGEMPVPTRDGYTFLGWFTASEGGNPVTSETVVSADMTIYARWESVISADVHEKVQLWEGGPYWATTNIGAEKPEDYGYYFWWGDTVGYKRENDDKWVSSDESNYIFSFNDINTPTYRKLYSALQNGGWITSDGVLVPAHDAVQKHWGGDWRMPTKQEFADLNSKCVWTWGSMNGVNGYIVCGMGDYASNSIFLPCAGCGRWASLDNAGSYGRYWSSVPDSGYDDACCLSFVSSGHGMSNSFRYEGLPLRPVQGLAK